MKKIVENELQNDLEELLGLEVLFLCASYFYHGTVHAVSDTVVQLVNAGIVYETGPWDSSGFKDKQKIPGTLSVTLQSVESYVPYN